ncbi:MAG: TonB family protein [Candidatus Obscuribacterales bacterium]|nr:TonB family protein [Candidatus Obscuribacterales bacterium]
MAQLHYAYAREPRDPMTAALLSMVPGLGQFYNGESRKGILFLDVAIINYALLSLVILAPGITAAMTSFGQTFHLKVNKGLLESLHQMQLGSPVSIVVLGLVLAFMAYAIRDAYDHAQFKRRRALYADAVVELPEATSGSYIFHASLIVALAITAFFFVIPKAPKKQLTVIEVMSTVTPPKPPVQSDTHSNQNSEAKIHKFDPKKTIQKTPAKSEPNKTQTQNNQSVSKQSSSTQSSAASSSSAAAQTKATTPSQSLKNPLAQAPSLPAPLPKALPIIRQSSTAAISSPARPEQMQAQAQSAANLTPKAMPLANSTPLPLLSAAQSQLNSVPLPILSSLPAGALPNRGTAAAMPVSAGRSSALANAVSLPSPGNVPQLGGSKVFNPISGPGASGKTQNSAAPGPLSIDTHSGSQEAGPVPQDMGRILWKSRGKAKGSDANGDSDVPAPIKARGRDLGSVGPIKISTGSPQSGSSDTPLNAPGRPGDDQAKAAKDPDFTQFMIELQRKIKRSWFPPKEYQSRRVKVLFKVHQNGQLSNLRVTQSSDVAVADQAALNAVESAAPFRHLPDGAPENVDIEFTFDYNVFSAH